MCTRAFLTDLEEENSLGMMCTVMRAVILKSYCDIIILRGLLCHKLYSHAPMKSLSAGGVGERSNAERPEGLI